jgi:hypothetical protein
LTGYIPILYILKILSKDLIETKKITCVDIEMRLCFSIRQENDRREEIEDETELFLFFLIL